MCHVSADVRTKLLSFFFPVHKAPAQRDFSWAWRRTRFDFTPAVTPHYWCAWMWQVGKSLRLLFVNTGPSTYELQNRNMPWVRRAGFLRNLVIAVEGSRNICCLFCLFVCLFVCLFAYTNTSKMLPRSRFLTPPEALTISTVHPGKK